MTRADAGGGGALEEGRRHVLILLVHGEPIARTVVHARPRENNVGFWSVVILYNHDVTTTSENVYFRGPNFGWV